VEEAATQCAFIRKVCNDLKITNLTLIKGDVFRFLQSCRVKYDVIFADPPYTMENFAAFPDLIFSKEMLKPDGLFVLEHSAAHSFKEHPHFEEHRNYGNVNFSFFV
jgi:16S rRNA G966 N2-methylase RsmD